MIQKLSTFLRILLCGFCLSESAQAAVIMASTASDRPIENVVLAAGPSTVTGQNTAWSNVRNLGQTFKLDETISLESVTFRMDVIGAQAPNADFVVNIYKFSSATDFAPDGVAIYTGEGTLPGTLSRHDYLTFTLDAPETLDANQYYGVVLSFSTPISGRQIAFYNSTTTPANLGTTVTYQNGEWGSRSIPLEMYIVGTAIPEPNVVLISFLGVALLIGGRSMRRARG